MEPSVPVRPQIGIKILHHDSLAACPEIILYEGIFDKDSYAVSLAVCEPAKVA